MTDKERIYIKTINIENCGRYYGSHEISFSNSSEKNITIIMGDSGLGKSTIYDLIYWCMYGEFKIHDKKDDDDEDAQDYGLINTDLLEDLNVGEETFASVSMSFYDEKGEKLFLTRTLKAKHLKDLDSRKFEPLNNSFVRKGTQFELSSKLKYKNDEGTKENTQDEDIIKIKIARFFPQTLSDFFLFDGENLEKFRYKSTSTGFIKKGVETISGLSLLDVLKITAGDTAEKIRAYIGEKEVDSAGLQKTYDTYKDKVAELEKTESDLIETQKKSQKQYDSVVAQMSQEEEGALLNKQLTDAENRKKELQLDLGTHKEKLREFLLEYVPNFLIKNTLEKFEITYQKLEDEDKVPPSINRRAIDKIIKSNPLTCVCGRKFEKNDSSWEKLLETKKAIIADEISQGLSNGMDLVGRVLDNSKNESVQKNFDDFTKEGRKIRDSLEKINSTIEELIEKTSHHKRAEGIDLGSKKSNLWQELDDLKGELTDTRSEIIGEAKKRDDCRKELDKLRKKEGKYDTENKKITILETLKKFITRQRNVIADKLREEVQISTNKYFLESAPEKDSFDHVEISDKYEIFARDSRNLDAPLSRGQRHVLGLSYVAGCRDVATMNTFLVIDSPLHNISGVSRNEIANALSKYLPGVQLILLVTDTEYTQGGERAKPVREILKPSNRIWKEFKIETDVLDIKNHENKNIQSRKIVELT